MAATWTVTAIAAGQVDFDGSGNPVTGHTVSFTTGEGQRDFVFIPDGHYTVANVRKLVQAKANLTDEVARLTSS